MSTVHIEVSPDGRDGSSVATAIGVFMIKRSPW